MGAGFACDNDALSHTGRQKFFKKICTTTMKFLLSCAEWVDGINKRFGEVAAWAVFA